MPRHVPTLILLASLAAATPALAQSVERGPVLVAASLSGGRVQGFVRDDIGRAVAGVSVLALGTTVGAARSDVGGRFSLELVPGDYVLRATRDGYVSTYRELIRIQTSALIERTITVVRRETALSTIGGVAAKAEPGPSELAWRLRHLTPSALREVSPAPGPGGATRNASSFQPQPSLLGPAMQGSVNFLTTGTTGAFPSQLPRGIASVMFGAPVGTLGDWVVRGAMTSTDRSSWVVLGEYQARERRTHAFAVGVSYSAQIDASGPATPFSAITDVTRSVGGLHGSDRWKIGNGVELEYGLRVDRYDYLTNPQLISPHLGARIAWSPSTRVAFRMSHHAIAPGADEFLPPPAGTPWLPPERKFTSLDPGAPFQAERVRHYTVGFEHDFGRDPNTSRLVIARFRQASDNQVATLFGLDATADSGHYQVATPGSVDVDGWKVRIAGRMSRHLRASVEYWIGRARWTRGPDTLAVLERVPSVVRATDERLQDVITSLEVMLPTDTRIGMVYRANTAFSHAAAGGGLPFPSGRFDFEVHQALPFHPIRGSRVELLLTIRNLYRDLRDATSLYDELLTVAPPLRLMGGFQVKF